MAGFKESNITLDFPTAKWFRFEKSEPYAQLSGFDFKEMEAEYHSYVYRCILIYFLLPIGSTDTSIV